MTGRSLGRLWRCRDCALGGPLKQTRTFASSSPFQKHGPVPSFSETSSPELDALLSQFRTKVFLPSRLSTAHQKLIYGTKNKRLLQDDPVTINISGEAFRLEHIDRKYDLPSHTKGILQAISLMKFKKDWFNLPPLLAGYQNSPNKLTQLQKNRLVRKAGKAGRLDVLLDCAKRVDYTGFKLDSPHIVAEIAWYAQKKASEMGWEFGNTNRELSVLEDISYLLEDKRHAGGYELEDNDPRVRPELLGVLLQLSAVLSVKHKEGKDDDGRVKKYAERLRAVVEAGEDILETGSSDKFGEDHLYLYRVAPVVHGIQLAQKIIEPGSALAFWLEAQGKVYGDAAEISYKKLSEKVGSYRRGLRSIDSYRRLLGPEAKL